MDTGEFAMSETVFVLIECVKYEGSRVLGVCADEPTAISVLDDEVENHRYDSWSYSNQDDDTHVISWSSRDVTLQAVEYEVQGSTERQNDDVE